MCDSGLEFHNACWCAGTGCGGHVKLNPAFAGITPAAHPCGTCGAPATSYYIAAPLAELYGCDAHPVLPHASTAIPWGSRFGTIGYQGAAQHTYTRSCDGLHGPGPCPQSQPPVTVGTWA